MSKHYEERTYVRQGYAGPSDYDDYRVRRRSSSRSSRGRYYDGYTARRISRSDSGSSISTVSEYDYKGHYVTHDRSLVRVPRDVIRAPTPPPVIQRVVERAPTPEPDIVERVIVRPQPQQLIERIIERPRTPPPKIIDKEITEPAPPPIVRTRIVKVDYSGSRRHGHYAMQSPGATYVPPKVIRPVEISRQSSLGNYGYYDGYDYTTTVPAATYAAPPLNRSYSQSFSTVELYPSTVYVPQAQAASVAYNIPAAQIAPIQPVTAAVPNLYQPTSSFCYPSQYNYPGAYTGFNYGYKPVGLNSQYGATGAPNMNQQQPFPVPQNF